MSYIDCGLGDIESLVGYSWERVKKPTPESAKSAADFQHSEVSH